MASAQEDLLFTNLLLLGFDPVHAEEQHKVSISREMFRRANVAAMEVVSHFLLLKLDPNHVQDIWPIMERQQALAFKKTVYAVFSQLEKDGHLPMNSVRLSHLQTCSGERFVDMLCSVSLYTMRLVMARDYGVEPPHNPGIPPASYIDTATRAAKLRLIRCAQRFTDQSREVSAMQHRWRSFATHLHKKSRELADLEGEYQRRRDNIPSGKPAADDPVSERCLDVIDRSGNIVFAKCEDSESIRVLEGVALGRNAPHRIEGSHLRLPSSISSLIPSLLPKEQLDLDSIRLALSGLIDGDIAPPVDISSLVKVWSVCLDVVQSRLSSVLGKASGDMTNIVCDVGERNGQFETIRRQTSSLVVELNRVHQLIRESALKFRNQMLSNSSKPVDLIPPTPIRQLPVVTTPVTSKSAHKPDTPFVMERLAQSVRRAVGINQHQPRQNPSLDISLREAEESLVMSGTSAPLYSPIHEDAPIKAYADPLDKLAEQLVSTVIGTKDSEEFEAVEDPMHAAFHSQAAFRIRKEIPRTPLKIDNGTPKFDEKTAELDDEDSEIIIKGRTPDIDFNIDDTADTIESEDLTTPAARRPITFGDFATPPPLAGPDTPGTGQWVDQNERIAWS